MKALRGIMHTDPIAKSVNAELVPGPAVQSERQLGDCTRDKAAAGHYPVDLSLQVHGIEDPYGVEVLCCRLSSAAGPTPPRDDRPKADRIGKVRSTSERLGSI